jgi:predicted amidohydrolase
MKICAAQTRPIKGDVQRNIESHKRLVDLAVANGVDAIIFPELSLTGYEPTLAKGLATDPDDKRLDDFQEISNIGQISIGVGVPAKSDAGICISMILFQPHMARRAYSKGYLHPDEEEFFIRGNGSSNLKVRGSGIALAICYEISIPEHLERALKSRPKIYFASVAKTVNGVGGALERLSEIAKQHSITVLMSNSIGPADGSECAGKSSIWNAEGELAGQLSNSNEGIIIIETETGAVVGIHREDACEDC